MISSPSAIFAACLLGGCFGTQTILPASRGSASTSRRPEDVLPVRNLTGQRLSPPILQFGNIHFPVELYHVDGIRTDALRMIGNERRRDAAHVGKERRQERLRRARRTTARGSAFVREPCGPARRRIEVSLHGGGRQSDRFNRSKRIASSRRRQASTVDLLMASPARHRPFRTLG